jgi:2',3'-cyclic-nucleotide 2'-phosphodiesterase
LRILFVGDVVGRAGRTAISEHLPGMVRDWALDLVIVNGENAAGGFGITEAIYQELLDAGADAVTLGNHAWDQREALVFIERAPKLIRPVNFPKGTPGRGAALIETKNGKRALVINAIGRVFMTPFDDPFARRAARSRASVSSATAAPASSSAPTPMCRPPIIRCCPEARPI